MKKLLLFIPIIIFIASCTITKRVHRPGYHISSNRNIKKPTPKKEADTFEVKTKEDSTKVENHKKVEKVAVFKKRKSVFNPNQKAEFKLAKTPVLKKLKYFPKEFIAPKITETKPPKITSKKVNENEITNTKGLLSFILMLVPIVSLILGVSALKEIKQNPEKYKNKWTAKIGFGVGLVATLLLALALSSILSVPIVLLAIASVVIVVRANKNTETNQNVKKQINKDSFGLWSFLLAVFGLAILIFSIFNMHFLTALIVIGILVFVVSLVLGVIAIKENKTKESKPKNSWMPILTVIGEVLVLLYIGSLSIVLLSIALGVIMILAAIVVLAIILSPAKK